jgi:putative redox protein
MGVKISGRYISNLTMEMIHCDSMTKLETDPPRDNGGDAKSFSPTDLLAAAAGSCMMSVMVLEARKRQLDLTGMECSIEKIMTSTLPRRVQELVIKISLPSHLTSETRVDLERIANSCPVLLSLSPEVRCSKTYSYI